MSVSDLKKLDGSDLVSDGDYICGLLTRHLVPLHRRLLKASRRRDPPPHRPSNDVLTLKEGSGYRYEGIEIGGRSRLCLAVSVISPSPHQCGQHCPFYLCLIRTAQSTS